MTAPDPALVERLLPPNSQDDGQHVVTDGAGSYLWQWHAKSKIWEGTPESGVDIATPEGAWVQGFRLGRAI